MKSEKGRSTRRQIPRLCPSGPRDASAPSAVARWFACSPMRRPNATDSGRCGRDAKGRHGSAAAARRGCGPPWRRCAAGSGPRHHTRWWWTFPSPSRATGERYCSGRTWPQSGAHFRCCCFSGWCRRPNGSDFPANGCGLSMHQYCMG